MLATKALAPATPSRRRLRAVGPALALTLAAAIGCAGELEGDPSRYEGLYTGAPPAAGGSGGSGATTQGGSSAAGKGSVGGSGAGAGSPTAGSGNPGGTVMVPPDPDCLFQVISKHSCTSCHTGTALAGGGLDLSGKNLGQRLSVMPAKYQGASGACDTGALVIDPMNHERSVFLRKVKNAQSCGSAMPLGTGLSGSDLTCIQDWIDDFSVSSNNVSAASNGGGDAPDGNGL